MIKLIFGNTYVPIKRERTRENAKIAYKWSMFLSIDGDRKLTEKYIERVEYYLTPCFAIDNEQRKHHPYVLSYIAFG